MNRSSVHPCSFQQYAAVTVLLLGTILGTACSGGSAPGAAANTTTAASSTGSASTTGASAVSTSTLTVSTTLPAATLGASYSTTVKVSGGSAPYTFAVTSGQLPQGLQLGNSSGSITGTPSASGTFSFGMTVADSKGESKQQSLQLTVSGAAAAASVPAPTGPSFSHLQSAGGWGQYGQKGPNYVDCSPSPCNGISFSMKQGVGSPSMSGQAAEFDLGGTAPFADGLWNNHLIGPSSSQGMPDNDQSIVPGLHDFTYDVYFYGDNVGASQALEFDINQFFGGMGFIWGHECRIAGGSEWDVYDNQGKHWTATGIPCHPKSNAWNHLTLKVQRTSDNHLVYQSITLNGQTSNLNWTFGHGSAPGWYGVTINYQMDGDQSQQPYNVYLDEVTFSYQ